MDQVRTNSLSLSTYSSSSPYHIEQGICQATERTIPQSSNHASRDVVRGPNRPLSKAKGRESSYQSIFAALGMPHLRVEQHVAHKSIIVLVRILERLNCDILLRNYAFGREPHSIPLWTGQVAVRNLQTSWECRSVNLKCTGIILLMTFNVQRSHVPREEV
ncbi:hypothetical protein BC835DRAFT_1337651, partial [Cytidiella melzeri]